MSRTQYAYADLLSAAYTRFGQVKEEQGRFRVPCVFHGGRNRNLVIFESGAAKCWSECGRTVVYELMANRELESLKIGRSRRILSSAVEAYVERLRGRARPDAN